MSVHIASLIVRVRPERADAVASHIAGMSDAEIHANEGGKIIVVLEAASERALADHMDALRQVPDVLMVSLVFHQMDADAEVEPA